MESVIRLASEAIVLIFNLLIYMQLTVCKKDNFITRFIMYTVGVISVGSFFVVTCMGILPESSASAICVTIPSFIVFFIMSKYKDFRFFVTFCFLDTVTFIFVFFIRTLDILCGDVAGIIGAVFITALMFFIYMKGKPYFRNYRELMSNVKEGWAEMAISTLLIYMLLIFSAAYPKPLIERTEQLPTYAFLAITVLSFYAVFGANLYQKKKPADTNECLMREKNWHEIATKDALTGMENRTAYKEAVRDVEKTSNNEDNVYMVMMDIDNFKVINDTFGHHTGDLVLKSTAERINHIFGEENYSSFRIGGDEFVVIARNVSREILNEKLETLKSSLSDGDISVSLSIGYSAANFEQKNMMEKAFIRADEKMYRDKTNSKNFDSEWGESDNRDTKFNRRRDLRWKIQIHLRRKRWFGNST